MKEDEKVFVWTTEKNGKEITVDGSGGKETGKEKKGMQAKIPEIVLLFSHLSTLKTKEVFKSDILNKS